MRTTAAGDQSCHGDRDEQVCDGCRRPPRRPGVRWVGGPEQHAVLRQHGGQQRQLGDQTRQTPNAQWSYLAGSSQSGVRSAHAFDLSVVATASLTSAVGVQVPTGTNSYLRFDHSYQMDSNELDTFYDGGVVEYSVDGGTSWSDAGSLPGTLNGYTGTLESGFGNPFGDRPAFSGASPSYQTTRINLSSLAGSTSEVRFRVGSDNSIGNPWLVHRRRRRCTRVPRVVGTAPMVSLVPARLLESRPELSTIDGQFNGIGVRGAVSVMALPVAGRGGVGGDAAAVVLNVTVTDALAAGFVTVYPCGVGASDGVELELCGWFDGCERGDRQGWCGWSGVSVHAVVDASDRRCRRVLPGWVEFVVVGAGAVVGDAAGVVDDRWSVQWDWCAWCVGR